MEEIINKTTYQYAPSWRRIISRILDVIFISLISFCFSLLFFINSQLKINDIFKPIKDLSKIIFEGWRVFGISVLAFIITFIYFVFLPIWTKGFTLFKFLFKIKIKTTDKIHSFFVHLFKREFLIWMTYYIFTIIASIIIWTSNDTINAFQGIFGFKQNDWFVWGIFIKSMYSLCGIINIALLIYLIMKNNSLALHDKYSNTFVYLYKNPIQSTNQIEDIEEQQKTEKKSPNLENSSLINNKKDWAERSIVNKIKTKRMQVEKLKSKTGEDKNE